MRDQNQPLFWLAIFAVIVCAMMLVASTYGAGYQTRNFTVNAPSAELAKQIGDDAEAWRARLAEFWLGQQLPSWPQPCPITARIANGAGGATSFVFDGGEVFAWRMNIQGSRQRLLDSVLPHEITHTVFASYFRRPLPRWADEGACAMMESRSEQDAYETRLVSCLKNGRGIPFPDMFAMEEYPRDANALYSQGHSLCSFLIERSSPKKFLEFLADGMRDNNWARAIASHYGFQGVRELQDEWLVWVKAGRPVFVTANFQGNCYGGQCYDPGYGWRPQGEVRIRSPIQIVRPQQSRPSTFNPQEFRPIKPPQSIRPRSPLAPSTDPPLEPVPRQPNPENPTPQTDGDGLKSLLVKIEARIAVLESKPGCTCAEKWAELETDLLAIHTRMAELEETVANIKRPDHETPIRVYLPDGRLAGESKANIFRGESIDFTFNPRALLDQTQAQ